MTTTLNWCYDLFVGFPYEVFFLEILVCKTKENGEKEVEQVLIGKALGFYNSAFIRHTGKGFILIGISAGTNSPHIVRLDYVIGEDILIHINGAIGAVLNMDFSYAPLV